MQTKRSAVLTTSDGATATLSEEGLAVRSATGQILFEYRATDQRCVVYAPASDLELRAKNLLLTAEEGVQINAKELTSAVERAELDADEVVVRSQTVRTALDYLSHGIGVMEVRATRLVERVENAYREVEGLSQTHAGRIRQVARGAYQLLGRRVVLKAEEDMKIKGEKIHLA